jgi:hypothetical protein
MVVSARRESLVSSSLHQMMEDFHSAGVWLMKEVFISTPHTGNNDFTSSRIFPMPAPAHLSQEESGRREDMSFQTMTISTDRCQERVHPLSRSCGLVVLSSILEGQMVGLSQIPSAAHSDDFSFFKIANIHSFVATNTSFQLHSCQSCS